VPSIRPLVLSCGGTGGAGGGVSSLFALRSYRKDAGAPAAVAKTGGRGVPDVAGDADGDVPPDLSFAENAHSDN
jgi:hypothetical protein